MGAFPFWLLFGRNLGTKDYSCPCGYKCPCHDRWYRQPWFTCTVGLVGVAGLTLLSIAYMSWTVDRDFPRQFPAGDIDTFWHYLCAGWRDFVDHMKHLW